MVFFSNIDKDIECGSESISLLPLYQQLISFSKKLEKKHLKIIDNVCRKHSNHDVVFQRLYTKGKRLVIGMYFQKDITSRLGILP